MPPVSVCFRQNQNKAFPFAHSIDENRYLRDFKEQEYKK